MPKPLVLFDRRGPRSTLPRSGKFSRYKEKFLRALRPDALVAPVPGPPNIGPPGCGLRRAPDDGGCARERFRSAMNASFGSRQTPVFALGSAMTGPTPESRCDGSSTTPDAGELRQPFPDCERSRRGGERGRALSAAQACAPGSQSQDSGVAKSAVDRHACCVGSPTEVHERAKDKEQQGQLG